MQKLVWKNSLGDEIDLTSGNYGITQWDGFSNTSLNIQSQQVPFQDSGIFLDALMEQRELSVTLKVQDNGNLEERYRMRRELIHALNPKLGEGYLIYTNDFISKRIKCVAQTPLFPTHNSNDTGTPRASLSWIACEPYWEDVEESSISFLMNEHPIINNNGDVPVNLEIDIFSQNVVNPSVKNETDGKYIEILGQYENSIKINTNIGEKEIKEESQNGSYLNTGANLNGIVYVENKKFFIAVGLNGQIIKSTNMYDWRIIKTSSSKYKKVIYVDYLDAIFAIGESSLCSVSSDGFTWTDLSIVSGTVNFNCIAFSAEKQIVVIGTQNGRFIYSTDGITWNVQNADYEVSINDITYSTSKELFVAVSDQASLTQNGVIYTSSDGITWTLKELSSSKINFTAVTNSNNLFVIGSNSHILISQDGLDWEDVGSIVGSKITSFVYSVKLGLFVGVTYSGDAIYSDNGRNWNVVQIKNLLHLNGIVYAGDYNYFVIVCDNGCIYCTDLIENTQRLRGEIANNILDITYCKKTNMYYAVGLTQFICKSYDKKDWQNINTYGSGSSAFNSIIYAEYFDKLFVVGTNGDLYTSTDGDNWTKTVLETNLTLRKVFYCDFLKKLFITTSGSVLLISDNGENWNPVTLSINNRSIIDYVIREDINKIYFITDRGRVAITSDGSTFEYFNSTVNNPIKMNYAKWLNLFFLTGEDSSNGSYIYYSSDCINWIQINHYRQFLTVIKNDESKKIIYIIGVDYTQGEESLILSSINGKSWNISYTGIKSFQFQNSYNDEKGDSFLCFGNRGIIYQIYFELNNNIINNLTPKSNMDLKLLVGDNRFVFNSLSGNFVCQLKYRQKYIGV